jgi:hypothetical protein
VHKVEYFLTREKYSDIIKIKPIDLDEIDRKIIVNNQATAYMSAPANMFSWQREFSMPEAGYTF